MTYETPQQTSFRVFSVLNEIGDHVVSLEIVAGTMRMTADMYPEVAAAVRDKISAAVGFIEESGGNKA